MHISDWWGFPFAQKINYNTQKINYKYYWLDLKPSQPLCSVVHETHPLSTLGGGGGDAMTPYQTLRGGNCSSKQALATETYMQYYHTLLVVV